MSCVHGHDYSCACGDCQIARCARYALPELRDRALIACQIQSGVDMTWTDRTYEVVRALDGQWIIHFGECAGPGERRRCWGDVLDWLRSLRPRDVELLEEP